MKVLVTGATGFLGTALCRQLDRQCDLLVRLNSRNCDLTQGDSLLAYNGHAFDRIYHLAAWTQAGDFCLTHPGEQWIKNQLINTNLLNWWQRCQPQAKLISMGTSCAYAPDQELHEENYLLGTPIDSLYTYAMTKRMLYIGQLALARQYGLKYLTLVPSTLYGPGYHTDGRQMHFIFDLIRKIFRGKMYDEPVVLWGDGSQKRELVFLEDFVQIALDLSSRTDNDLVNVGAGEEFSIRFFAEVICQLIGFDFAKVRFDASRYVDARSKCLNTEKLRRLLPNAKLTALEVGLPRTIAWFWDNRHQLLPPPQTTQDKEVA